ncbi:Uma2 family endonuclease [Nonomuraea sp. NPDC050790]|uniref:Uma2 family endonuclease n=1 Tax=Nonomuraea sp. NPDC050790 TaxID=3364371 RepID=UPI00378CBEB5
MVAMFTRPRVRPYEAPADELPRTVRELFDALPPLPGLRVEVIEGNLHVSPMGTPRHQALAMRLARLLQPVQDKHDWEAYVGVDICIEGPRDTFVPDYALAPKDCPLWGNELRSTGVVMVAEIVSPGSVTDDYDVKPPLYAMGGIPVCLVIDPIADTLTVHSDIVDDSYRTTVTQDLGTTVHLPEPVDYDLDTAELTE